jgi:hypothetical protein
MITGTRMLQKARPLAFLIVMALPGVGLAQPSITALSFTPAAINTSAGPANVTVNFSLSDASSGVLYFQTAFVDPSGFFYQSASKLFSPTSNSVTDSVTMSFPQFSTSGTWTLATVFIADTAGNTLILDSNGLAAAGFATTLQVSSTADTTPPNITAFSFTPATIDTTAASANVTVNFTLTDDFAGANFFQVGFLSPTGQSRQIASKNLTPSTSVTDSVALTFPRFSEAGAWTVSSVFVSDAAGNTLVLATSDLTARGFPTTLAVTSTSDTTPPTLANFGFTPTSINVTGFPATVTVSYQVTDDLSGATTLQAVFTGPSGFTTQTASASFAASTSATGTAAVTFPKGSENGTWTVTSVFLSDASGNTVSLTTAQVAALGFPTQLTVTNAAGDTTPPVIVPTVNPAPNGMGWNTTVPVTVSWSVTDPESGINTSSGCGNSTVSAETSGVTFTCSATNNAGLSNSASVTVRVDLTPPIITPSVSPSPTAAGWNNTNVTVTWTATDPTSGVAADATSGCDPMTLSAETAGTVITCTATNGAGLMRSVSVTIKIDKTPPTAVASATPAPNGAGWNNTNVTVAFAGTDALSGIAFCTAPVVLSTEGTGLSASGTCTDNAGNVSAPASVAGIKIDKTAPVASNVLTTPAQVYINNGTTISATITDSGGSNLASAEYNVDGGSFLAMTGTFGGSTATVSATTPVFTATGVHNICVRGDDIAGNIGTPVCTTVAVFTAAAPASGTTCNGAYNGTFTGSIFVSTGQVCDLEGTVTGSITQTGGTLILLNASVGGTVQVVGGIGLSVKATTINGSLQIVSLPSSTAVDQVCGSHIKSSVQVSSSGTAVHIGEATSCAGNTIDGALQVTSNSAQTQLIGNHVGGSLQDNSNVTSVSPATQVTSNIITGALQCSGNSSIVGGGNTASVKQGQCSTF